MTSKQLYRTLLKQYRRSSIQSPSDRSPSVATHLRALFDRPKGAATLKPAEVETMGSFMRSNRMHQDLVKRYNSGTDLTEPDRIKATARRVGLDVPKLDDIPKST